MKKFLTITFILIAILSMCICFTACQPQTVYYLPEIVADIDGLTIEHVNNIEKDYNLPINLPEQFTHEEFVTNESLSSAYLIKNNGELVGWIIGGFGTSIQKGKVQYGVYADHSNGEDLHFAGGTDLRVYLSKDDEGAFDKLKFTSNCGKVNFIDKFECLDENNEATDYICGYYQLDLTGIDPKTVDKITIVLTLEE